MALVNAASWWTTGCLSMASAVLLGAFGAHKLKSMGITTDPYYKDLWTTATTYHVIHSLGILLASKHLASSPKKMRIANLSFLAGIVLFSGSLYTLTLTQKKWLGAITPIGGTLFIMGWVAAAFP